MMTGSLRSRLWLGYGILTVLVLGAFLLGLLVTLNGSTVLYRQVVSQLQDVRDSLLLAAGESAQSDVEGVQAALAQNPPASSVRVLMVSDSGEVLFDDKAAAEVSLNWSRLLALRRVAYQESSGLVRDAEKRMWIYTAAKLPNSQSILVVASRRQNLTLRFMFSDPMIRLVFRVMVLAAVVSLVLTLLMDRWIARPIRRMAQRAGTLATSEGAQIPVEGIKETRELAIALNQMSRKVQQSQQSQRDFVSDVSHELKTPLTSIQGFSAAILDGTAATPDEVRHSAEVITAESQRMLGMVNELLTLARLEGRVEKLELHPTDLAALLQGVVEKLALNAKRNHVDLICQITGLPQVMADPEKLTQVFLNLVENAIKFTPPGGMVKLSPEADAREIRVAVADTGQGMTQEDLEKIFNRFYQVDRSRKAGAGKSTGLGLTIAREIVRLHNGTITVASTPGAGTTFTVHLPLTPPQTGK
jgi:signal transduction histidine kinase